MKCCKCKLGNDHDECGGTVYGVKSDTCCFVCDECFVNGGLCGGCDNINIEFACECENYKEEENGVN